MKKKKKRSIYDNKKFNIKIKKYNFKMILK